MVVYFASLAKALVLRLLALTIGILAALFWIAVVSFGLSWLLFS